MIAKTLYFGNPAYLSLKNEQMLIKLLEVEVENGDGEKLKTKAEVSRPVEDIGIVILDNPQVTITHGLMSALLKNNAAIIQCNSQHLPHGLMLNLDGHTLQALRFRYQIEATEPLKKQLWQQTVTAKIMNQCSLLKSLGKETKKLEFMIRNMKSGDTDNYEAQAAAYYWSQIFSSYIVDFKRDREGAEPNMLLNYGYSILRAAVARSLVGSGLLPTLGIFHRNQYNAYCLADDIMEPYRPFVDMAVWECVKRNDYEYLSPKIKESLFKVLEQDVHFEKSTSPLMVGLTRTTASLSDCFEGKKRKINYPQLYAT